ncbi:MAG: hypothetical protein WC822_06710 [Candidatus Paceibacterota bacterium]
MHETPGASHKDTLYLKEAPRPSIKELSDNHRQMLRLIFNGASNEEVAEETGFTKEMVSLVRRSDIAQERLSEMHTVADTEAIDVQRRIAQLVPVAIEVYRQVVEDPTSTKTEQLRAADAICDRGGLPKQSATTITGAVAHTHASTSEIVSLKRQAIEAAREMGLLVDVTPTSSVKSLNAPSIPAT